MNLEIKKADNSNQVAEIAVKLYQNDSIAELQKEFESLLKDNNQLILIGYFQQKTIAFAHLSIRHEYVNGMESNGPVGYLEGIYVDPSFQRQNIATSLLNFGIKWLKEQNITELISDALIDNIDSYNWHQKLGFAETERVVYFRKEI